MDGDVREMRLVVTAPDYEAARAFYRDVLGMREVGVFSSPGGHVTILDAGRATLELADPAHAAYVDEVEVGRRVAGHVRVALQVPDAAAATDRSIAGGATLSRGLLRHRGGLSMRGWTARPACSSRSSRNWTRRADVAADRRYFRRRRQSDRISRAAFAPGRHVTPPPGWAPAPHR
jgi:lactoylglutathione lyase